MSNEKKIVLIGNPNCGKTTLFNALTGLKYKVANYPGVTVEKKEGPLDLPGNKQALLIDLPGTYTLAGESLDEQVAAKALEEKPDMIIAVADAANLERNLYLVSELIDLGIPTILALNMIDLAEKRGIQIRSAILTRLLDLPVIQVAASSKIGVEQVRAEVANLLDNPKTSTSKFAWANGDQALMQTSLVRNQLSKPGEYGAVASARYRWLGSIVSQCVSQQAGISKQLTDKIDAIATHRFWGLIVFFLVMAIIFQSIFSWAAWPMELIDSQILAFGDWLSPKISPGMLRSLVIDGILAGVGSVLVFIPQIALLFFFIGILEDSGYLCRAAFVMDRIMRKVGLQGRSFIPLLSSFACAIPGIMSTRSIPSLADRFITILVAPLMSCSARIPVYTVLIAAFIPKFSVYGIFSLQGLVLLAVYVLGVLGAAIAARLFKLVLFRGEPALFVMEMPPFRAPSLVLVLREVWDRVMLFIKGAGTVILACSVLLWFLASHPTLEDGSLPAVRDSYAGMVGGAIEPVIKPLGFNWEIGIGLFASFAAREVFVSTLSTVYNLQSEDESAESLTKLLKDQAASGAGFGLATALSLLVFYVFACQCMSTLAVCRRETGSWKWPALMFAYMTLLAYLSSFVTYQVAKIWL